MSLISFLLTIFHVSEYLNNSVLPPGWINIIVLLTFLFWSKFYIFRNIGKTYITDLFAGY